jgi:hypothetical protein
VSVINLSLEPQSELTDPEDEDYMPSDDEEEDNYVFTLNV